LMYNFLYTLSIGYTLKPLHDDLGNPFLQHALATL